MVRHNSPEGRPLVRPMLVEGTRLTTDTATTHELDPRGPDAPVHGDRSTTRQYVNRDDASRQETASEAQEDSR